MGKCAVCKALVVLVAIGAINWGLVTFFDFNLVTKILGDMTTGSKVVYGLVGAAGLVALVTLVKPCPCVKKA